MGATASTPNAVDVVLIEPEQGVGDEEVPHLVAGVVEHERTPALVLALTGGQSARNRWEPSKKAKTVGILREVTGHPVHN